MSLCFFCLFSVQGLRWPISSHIIRNRGACVPYGSSHHKQGYWISGCRRCWKWHTIPLFVYVKRPSLNIPTLSDKATSGDEWWMSRIFFSENSRYENDSVDMKRSNSSFFGGNGLSSNVTLGSLHRSRQWGAEIPRIVRIPRWRTHRMAILIRSLDYLAFEHVIAFKGVLMQYFQNRRLPKKN